MRFCALATFVFIKRRKNSFPPAQLPQPGNFFFLKKKNRAGAEKNKENRPVPSYHTEKKMADDSGDDLPMCGAMLELRGDGYRFVGTELYEFLELDRCKNAWDKRDGRVDGSERAVTYYKQKMQPFFSGDELTHDDFFALCGTFTSMVRRLGFLANNAERKSTLKEALNPRFLAECIPFGHSGAGKVLLSKVASEDLCNKENARHTTTSVQPGCVWSPVFNPLRSLAEWTCGLQTRIEFNWTERLDAEREIWTFACRPTAKGIVRSIDGMFCTGNQPDLRIRFTLDLGQLTKIDEGYLFTRKDFVLTVLNQHQHAVFAYFATLFENVSQNARGIVSLLLADRIAAYKRD